MTASAIAAIHRGNYNCGVSISLETVEQAIWSVAPKAKGTDIERILAMVQSWAAKPAIPKGCPACQDRRLNQRKGRDTSRYILNLPNAGGRKTRI
jgi:hypothetical protein